MVFIYTAPFFVALGSYRFLGERLRASQWGGLALCFAGVALAIGVPQADVDAEVLLGDLMIVGGGALWAATTLLVKATSLIRAPAEKALGYQVAMSIPILALAAWTSGETITHVPGPLSLSLLAYQAIWVVGLTFLLWFALVKTYSASKLSAFTFITPLFGVVASYFIMHDTLTPAFGVAALLVIAGLCLVNSQKCGAEGRPGSQRTPVKDEPSGGEGLFPCRRLSEVRTLHLREADAAFDADLRRNLNANAGGRRQRRGIIAGGEVC